jgi:long-chain acyl-CoA synthetase
MNDFTAGMSLVICENDEKCKSLLNDVPTCLKMMVHMKPISNETIELAKTKGINILSFEHVERLGAQHKHKPTVSCPNLN